MAFTVIRRANAMVAAERNCEQPTTTFVIEESTGYLLSQAARLFGRTLQARFAPHGVAVGQWSILLCLWEEDGLSQRELSRRVGVEEPTITRTLGRMERDGLVRRHRNEQDRRQVMVRLSERGHELRDELVPYALEVNALATHGLSEADKAKLNSLLSYLIARLA